MDDCTRLNDGKAVIFLRGNRYHVRVQVSANRYAYRSLKTDNKAVAVRAAEKLCQELAFRADQGLPFAVPSFAVVIDQYVAYRERQHQQGRTSAAMLRQVRRVSRFWRQYAGHKPITAIDHTVLKQYETWRRDYYRDVPLHLLPPNAKPICTDQTVQWDMMLGKAMLKWAHEQGYRGNLALPTYSYCAKTRRVRPAFTRSEFQQLEAALAAWIDQCTIPAYQATRLLLQDYVLTLAYSGLRVGEANSLKIANLVPFVDEHGRSTYQLMVTGKTGQRSVIPRVVVRTYLNRCIARKHNPKADDLVFAMPRGGKITTLIDQFNAVLAFANLTHNAYREKFSLYSLRHTYAMQAIDAGIPIYDLARNMGTSVDMIQTYYGRHANTPAMTARLGGAET